MRKEFGEGLHSLSPLIPFLSLCSQCHVLGSKNPIFDRNVMQILLKISVSDKMSTSKRDIIGLMKNMYLRKHVPLTLLMNLLYLKKEKKERMGPA